MPKNKPILFSDLNIDYIDYANQGNACLGIRGAGKTYAAGYNAERLMEYGVPIVVLDPVGVWRYLRVDAKDPQKEAFPIVVVGEDGDIPLVPELVSEITEQAMIHNVNIVFDLYSMYLSKAAWRRIVGSVVDTLLYKNKKTGTMRHLFIEEAAHFAPQRVTREVAEVYGKIESLARMGRNAGIGFTLINQRPQEVNKAVLELCDGLLLMRQKGSHSISSLAKWLSVAGADGNSDVVKNSLATLSAGVGWYWQEERSEPVLVQIPQKTSFHPNSKELLRSGEFPKTKEADVSGFVQVAHQIIREMEERQQSTAPRRGAKKQAVRKTSALSAREPMLPANFRDTRDDEIKSLQQKVQEYEQRHRADQERIMRLRNLLKPQYDVLSSVFQDAQVENSSHAEDAIDWEVWIAKLVGKQKDILRTMIKFRKLSKSQLALQVGMSKGSGTFADYITKLVSLGLIERDGDNVILKTD